MQTVIRWALAMAVGAGCVGAQASLIGYDDASTTNAYFDHDFNGDNGGYGFGPWAIRTQNNAGDFSATSAGNADLNNVDINDRAWGFYANGGAVDLVTGFRAFSGGMNPGQTFGISMEHGGIATAASVGFVLRNGNANSSVSDYNTGARFEFLFLGGSNNYLIVDASGLYDTGIPWNNSGLRAELTLQGYNNYDLRVTTLGNNSNYVFTGRSLSGTANATLDSVALYDRNADQNDVFFNQMQVPEPTSAALLGLAALVAFRRRRAA